MSISSLKIAQLIRSKLSVLGDMRQACTYYLTQSSTYTPGNGGTVTPVADSGHAVSILFDSFSKEKKVILSALDLPSSPTKGDTITDAAGKQWRVLNVATDPSGSIHELEIEPYGVTT